MSVMTPTQRPSKHGKSVGPATDRRRRSGGLPSERRNQRHQSWPARPSRGDMPQPRTTASNRVSSRSPAPRRTRSSRRFSAASVLAALEESFVYLGFAVSLGLIAITGSDLLTGFPFKSASLLFDWGFLVSGFIMLGLSWDVFRDQHAHQGRG